MRESDESKELASGEEHPFPRGLRRFMVRLGHDRMKREGSRRWREATAGAALCADPRDGTTATRQLRLARMLQTGQNTAGRSRRAESRRCIQHSHPQGLRRSNGAPGVPCPEQDWCSPRSEPSRLPARVDAVMPTRELKYFGTAVFLRRTPLGMSELWPEDGARGPSAVWCSSQARPLAPHAQELMDHGLAQGPLISFPLPKPQQSSCSNSKPRPRHDARLKDGRVPLRILARVMPAWTDVP